MQAENKANSRSIIIRISLLVALLGAVISLCINFYLLDKGFILSDSAWYMTLIRDMPSDGIVTQYYFFWQAIFGDNILYYSMVNLIINYVSFAFLSLGIYYLFFHQAGRFVKKHYFSIVLWTFALSYYAFRYNPTIVPSYVNMNTIAINFSLGFLFLALSGYRKLIYFVLSGFFLGFLTFIMITNIVFYPLVLLLTFIQTRRFIDVACIVGGIIGATIFYFLFLQDFDLYYACIMKQFNSSVSSSDKPYGFMYILRWSAASIYYIFIRYLCCGFLLYLFCRLFSRAKNNLAKLGYILFALACVAAMFIFSGKIVSFSYANNFPLIWYMRYMGYFTISYIIIIEAIIGYAFIAVLFNKKTTKMQKLQWLFLSSIPFMLSIGTLLPYQTRATVYLSYLAVLPCYALIRHFSLKVSLIILSMICILFFNFCVEYKKMNWFKEASPEQTTLLPEQQIYVREGVALMLQKISEHLQPGDFVLVNKNWGPFYLSNSVCIDYNFATDIERTCSLLQEKYCDIDSLTILSFVGDAKEDHRTMEAINKLRPVDVKTYIYKIGDGDDLYDAVVYELQFKDVSINSSNAI